MDLIIESSSHIRNVVRLAISQDPLVEMPNCVGQSKSGMYVLMLPNKINPVSLIHISPMEMGIIEPLFFDSGMSIIDVRNFLLLSGIMLLVILQIM